MIECGMIAEDHGKELNLVPKVLGNLKDRVRVFGGYCPGEAEGVWGSGTWGTNLQA